MAAATAMKGSSARFRSFFSMSVSVRVVWEVTQSASLRALFWFPNSKPSCHALKHLPFTDAVFARVGAQAVVGRARAEGSAQAPERASRARQVGAHPAGAHRAELIGSRDGCRVVVPEQNR